MAKKIKTPGKYDDLSVSLVTWPKGKTIDRIHWSQYGAAEFNPGKGLDVSAQLLIVRVASYRRFMAVKRWLLP